ncbi:MAG: ParB/RepB/Spo0J family partition protein [Deltaproteobacteria bacterium]|nr:ParB/RepB/Spo0J family partition protein [Deltaproteobacteria bacterium]
MADPTGAYEKGQLYQLELAHLQADPNQPRKSMDPQALEDLTESVRQHGVLMPILFRVATGHDPYSSESGIVSPNSGQVPGAPYIVAGERRFEAAKIAGLTTIPAIYLGGNDAIVSPEVNYAEIALVENLLRQDLTAVGEAEALGRLMTEQNYTQEQLGAIIGKARTTVTDIMTLNKLPQEIRDECRGNTAVTRKALISIARKKQVRSMVTAWNKIKEKQAKEAAGGQRKARTALTPDAHREWIDKTNAKLAVIDPAAWTAEEVTAFAASLGELKKTILALLKTKPATPA